MCRMADKTYWVGDDRDYKSVCIKRVIYVKGDEIPADDVAQELLDKWQKNGLIAVGDSAAPVVIVDTQAVTNLKTEIASLTRETDRIPGLEREVKDLKTAAEKAKGGSKAKAAKAKDDRIKELEENAVEGGDRIEELELDVKEKAALIEKQGKEIKDLKADLETATAPDKSGDGPGSSEDSAGPGGG